MIIPLTEVSYDPKARDGRWCMLPYPNHPHGCPKFPTCPMGKKDFLDYEGYDWFAVIEEFDLKSHADRMREKHPQWTERQCRNLLYWQNGVRSRLKKKAEKLAMPFMGDVILDIPEANGVNIFETMANHGVIIERDKPMKIKKIMLVGKPKSSEFKEESECISAQ